MNNVFNPSTRAQVVTRRTYNRHLDKEGKIFETWEQSIDRVIDHQKWLWERVKGTRLTETQKQELNTLRRLLLERKVSVSGRTLWLGGTEVAKKREASQFNCAFTKVETVYDVVDCLWLLLQGCGVGFKPVVGTLNGFFKPIKNIKVIRSERKDKGDPNNFESWDSETKTWHIKIGDSAEAWAKSIGKLLAGKYSAETLILDYSEIRPSGQRLNGYGWISSGDEQIYIAYNSIAGILNKKAGSLLTKIDILDIMNHLGTILSSRRSAQIALFDYGSPEWKEFAIAKKDYWLYDNDHRRQSNNSLMFWKKPEQHELEEIFELMVDAGGSEPGFINGEAALKKAPWFVGVNPCGEVLLSNKCFCNLVETDAGKFHGDTSGFHEAIEIAARANYRQTCVDFRDGILQEAWHHNNEFLRLCGVGLTGIATRPDLTEYDFATLQRVATYAAYDMADELGLQRPKNVTTVKPSGTLSKIMDTTEGVHKPLGRYIINNIQMGKHDPLVEILREGNYKIINHPSDITSVLVAFPIRFDSVEFDIIDGVEVNIESAVKQLDRYKMVQNFWCHQNVSNTISYSKEEIPDIIRWLLENWDSYIGVSFIYRTDPTKTAEDLGHPYLPQEVVTKEVWEAYEQQLKKINIDNVTGFDELDDDGCSMGICPVK